MFDRPTLMLLGQTMCVLGALGVIRLVYLRNRAEKAASWPSTPGIVRSVSLRKAATSPSISGHSVRTRVYIVSLSYSYSVGGKQYVGTRVQFGAPRRETVRDAAEERYTRYRVDQEVSVRYDPVDPRESVLDTALDPALRRSVIVATALLLVGCLTWWGA